MCNLSLSHTHKHMRTAKETSFISKTDFIPHGQVHRHPAPTPGTPRAPWPCSRPGRGWLPGGRRPGNAGGCPDTKQKIHTEFSNNTLSICCLTKCCTSLITSCALCKTYSTVNIMNKITWQRKEIKNNSWQLIIKFNLSETLAKTNLLVGVSSVHQSRAWEAVIPSSRHSQSMAAN